MTSRFAVERCDNCGSRERAVYGEDPASGAVHPTQWRCARCGLVYADPRVAPTALAQLYDEYFSAWEAVDDAGEREKRVSARRILAQFRELCPPPARLLDVGAGTGVLVTEARGAGYEASGIDISEGAVALAASLYGLQLRQGAVEDLPPDAGLDVVVAWHVIEHAVDLDRFVAIIRAALRPGGLFVVGTEAYDYPLNSVLRARSRFARRPPRTVTSTLHTFVFSRASLRDALERRGFETVRLRAYDELNIRRRVATAAGERSGVRALAAQAVALPPVLAGRALRRGPYLEGVWRAT